MTSLCESPYLVVDLYSQFQFIDHDSVFGLLKYFLDFVRWLLDRFWFMCLIFE